jgi:hypothetical protein
MDTPHESIWVSFQIQKIKQVTSVPSKGVVIFRSKEVLDVFEEQLELSKQTPQQIPNQDQDPKDPTADQKGTSEVVNLDSKRRLDS